MADDLLLGKVDDDPEVSSPSPGNRRAPAVVLDGFDAEGVVRTADCLLTGGVVAFPTDTVYALAASLAHPVALDRIFRLKGRPRDKPLPVLLSGVDHLSSIALNLDQRVTELVARFWPGPLTVVVPARRGLPDRVIGPRHTVAARVPDHALAVAVLARGGGAVAATSANRSGLPPARTAEGTKDLLGDGPDLILDGGPTPGGVPSTIVRVAEGRLLVVREGAITAQHLHAAWDDLLTTRRCANG